MKLTKQWLRILMVVLTFSLAFTSTVLADGETGTVGWDSLAQFKTGTLNGEQYNVYAGSLYLDMTTGERVPVFCTDILHHVNNGKAFYASDEEMDCRIAWLLQNYPPTLKEDYSANDVPGSLSSWSREMAARQAAVWYFSDGYNPIGAGESADTNNWDIALRAMEMIDSVPSEACELLTPDLSISPASAVNLQGEAQTFTVNLTQGGEPIAGAEIALSATAGELSADMVTTDEQGTATFTLVMNSAGSAEVVASTTRPLYVGTIFLGKDSANYQKLVLGKDTSGLVFGTAAATWQGTGSITAVSFSDYNMNGTHEDGEPLLKSWSISLKASGVAKTAKTNDQGRVTFSNLADGDYTVKESVQNGWLATTLTSYDVTVAGDAHTVYFGQIKLPVIIGQKYEDVNLNSEWDESESALSGWELQLFREDGSAVIGMKGETDEEGQVIFSSDRNPTDLLPGTYFIQETLKDGWLPTDGLSKTFSVKATDVLEVPIGNTTLSDVCVQSGECFEIEYFGYQDNPDGTTTITFKVTDICKYDVSYIAFGTNGWTRIAPPEGSYDGELGNYNVVWTNENGNPGFTSVKFETNFDGYSEGASEVFELVVDEFDPDEPMLIQGHAGRGQEVEQYIFSLNNPACVPVANPDLSLTKDGPASAFAGDTINYQFTVENTGDVELSAVTVTDPLLGGEVCAIDSLAVGETAECSAVYTMPGDQALLTNTATAQGTAELTGETVSATDTHEVELLAPSCQLFLNGQPAPFDNSAWTGENDEITVILENLQEPVAYNWDLWFPTDHSGVTGLIPGFIDGTTVYAGGSGEFTESGTYTFTIPYPPEGGWGAPGLDGYGTFESHVNIWINEPCSDQGWDHWYKAPWEADLSLTKVASAEEVFVGEQVAYTLEVTNEGPQNAQEYEGKGVKVTDVLPAGMTFVSAEPSQGTCEYLEDTREVSCDLGAINYLNSASVEVVAIADVAGELVNTATVTPERPSDPNPDNNTASSTVTAVDLNSAISIVKGVAGLVPEVCTRPIDLVYVLDLSGSMSWNYPGAGDKFEAAQQAIVALNAELAEQGDISRVALVTFNNTSAKVQAGFTNDFESVSTLVQNMTDNPTGNTPTTFALRKALGLLLQERDPEHLPVVVLLTDGVPNIDTFGQANYKHLEIQDISLYADDGSFLTSDIIRTTGNYVADNDTYMGQPLADAMDAVALMRSLISDVKVYGVAIQGDGSSGTSFSEDLLEYVAYYTGAEAFSADSTDALVASMLGLLEDSTCGAISVSPEPELQACVDVNFNDYIIESYESGEGDNRAVVSVEDDGATLHMLGNTWRKIANPVSLTAETYLTFDFWSPAQGEIQGLGFDNNDAHQESELMRLYGTQDWGSDVFANYESSAPGVKSYAIPVGLFFNGDLDYMTFVNDQDVSNPVVDSYFSNMKFCTIVPSAPADTTAAPKPTFKQTSLLTKTIYAGDFVTYTYDVNNPGEVELTDVTVIDDKCAPVQFVDGDADGDGKLDLDETWSYICTTQLYVDTLNTATTAGVDSSGKTVTLTDTAFVKVIAPAVDISKSASAESVYAGETVTYTYEVTNPGSDPLDNVMVSDDKCAPVSFTGGDVGEDGILSPGEVWVYSCAAELVEDTTNVATVTAFDSRNGEVSATATATVVMSNQPPEAIDDTAETLMNNEVVIPVLDNDSDPDGDELTVTEVSTATHGTVVINPDGTVTYTPEDGFIGEDTFTYTMTDGQETDTATVTVTVLDPCPDPDAARDLSARIVQNPENPLEWWGIVTNKSDVCVYDVGMASYKKFDNVLNHQELYDSDESYEIGPGETVLTVVAPDCGTQLDVFFSAKHLGEGPEYDMVPLVLPEFGREDLYGPYGTRYGPRLLAAKHIGEDDFCGIDPGLCSFNSMTIEGIEDGQYLSGVVNVRALFDNVIPSKVQFNLVGPMSKTHVENIDPYYFLGDTNQQPNGWDTDTYPAGTYTMTITAYEEWWPCVTQEFDLYIVDELNPAIDIEADGPAEAHEGDDVTYDVTVTNTGDATLDVVVPLPDGTEWTGTLEPGTSTTFTTTATIPDGAADPYEETFTATGTDTLGEEVIDSDTVSTDILKPGIDIEADGPAEAHEGDDVTYDVTVTNTGDATLDVVVPLPDGTEWTGTLEPGTSTTFTTTATIPDGAADPYEQTFTATGTDALGQEVTDSDTVSTDVIHPAIVVKADGPALAHEGDMLTYQVIVMNTGDTSLDVVVPLPDGTEWTGSIDADGSASFSATSTVPDGADDPYDMTFTATGTDSLGAEVSGSDSVSTDILKPAIAIVKRASAESVYEGSGVTYSYQVTNVGEDPLFNVIVRDDKCTPVNFVDGDTDGDSLLDTDETWNYICAATLFETTTNTGTAYGADELGMKVVASDQATVVVMPLNPAISITKEADQEVSFGSSVVFTITVANTGDVDLTDVTVVDELAPSCDRSFDVLAVGASESFTCVVDNVTEDFVNTAIATGKPPVGEDVDATDTAAVTVIANEPLTVEVLKMADVEMLDEPGGLASFTVEVLNPNRDVTLISLVDDPYGDVTDPESSAIVESSCETGVAIPAGGLYTCSFTVEILGEPGEYFDYVTAIVTDASENTAEATGDAMVTIVDVLPSVDVELDVTPTVVPVPSEEGPELVMYTGQVTNTSNEVVTLVSLYDPWDESGENLVCIEEDGCAIGMELEPGQTCDCSFQGEIYGEAGDIITRWLKAVVEDNDGNSADDEDDASVTIEAGSTEPVVESITFNKVWWNTEGMEVEPPTDLDDFQIVATSDLGQAICSYVEYDDYVEFVCDYDNVEPYNQEPYGNDALWILLDEYGYGYYTVEELNIPEGWEADEIGLGEQVYIQGESSGEHLVNNFQLPGTVSYSMELTKTVNLAEANPGDTLLYDITLKNTGTGSLTDVEIYDFLPSYYWVTYIPGTATCTGCDSTPTYGEDTLSAYVAILEPGESLILSFPAQVNGELDAGTIIENMARGSSAEAPVVQASVQTNVVGEPVGAGGTPEPLDDDGQPGYLNSDADGDGIPDEVEGSGDLDGDGTPDYMDTDADGDGILDSDEGSNDLDGDGIPNYLDTDADGDGIPDADEGTDDLDGDGVPNYLDTDADGDGILDSDEGSDDLDGDGIPNYLDTDADGDGIPDAEEGTGDVDGDGIPNYLDTDADGDGIFDVDEGTGDMDGDGLPNYLDTDADGDGIPDSYEGTGDADGDGAPNYLDTDADGDGIPDAEEGTGDADGDGLLDYLDTDADGDTVPDVVEGTVDTDSDGIPDYLDTDDDGDGILTRNEDVNGDGDPTNDDSDGDGVPNYLDADDDGDGILTSNEDINGDGDPTNDDSDGDGIPNYLDTDDDDDGIPTALEDGNGDGDPANDDADGDGIPNYLDPDSDNDGLLDSEEWSTGADDPLAGCTADDPVCVNNDADGDGVPNYLDLDSDDDGLADSEEGMGDADGDGVPDWLDPDPAVTSGGNDYGPYWVFLPWLRK